MAKRAALSGFRRPARSFLISKYKDYLNLVSLKEETSASLFSKTVTFLLWANQRIWTRRFDIFGFHQSFFQSFDSRQWFKTTDKLFGILCRSLVDHHVLYCLWLCFFGCSRVTTRFKTSVANIYLLCHWLTDGQTDRRPSCSRPGHQLFVYGNHPFILYSLQIEHSQLFIMWHQCTKPSYQVVQKDSLELKQKTPLFKWRTWYMKHICLLFSVPVPKRYAPWRNESFCLEYHCNGSICLRERTSFSSPEFILSRVSLRQLAVALCNQLNVWVCSSVIELRGRGSLFFFFTLTAVVHHHVGR